MLDRSLIIILIKIYLLIKFNLLKELYALGLSSSLASFFAIYPISCSISRTLVNTETGTKTQLSIFFSSIFLGSIIIYFGQWLKTLPMVNLTYFYNLNI